MPYFNEHADIVEGDPPPLDPDLQLYVRTTNDFDVLQHPLVYAVPYMPAMNELHNIQLRQKRECIAQLEAEGNWGSAIWYYERPYRLDAFLQYCSHMSSTDYWKTVRSIWIDTENAWQELYAWRKVWVHGPDNRELVMNTDERAKLASLPAEVTVYRGTQDAKLLSKHGLSWTRDMERARFFALRWRSEGYLLQGTILRDQILAYLDVRGEAEVVVDGRQVRNLEVHKLVK